MVKSSLKLSLCDMDYNFIISAGQADASLPSRLLSWRLIPGRPFHLTSTCRNLRAFPESGGFAPVVRFAHSLYSFPKCFILWLMLLLKDFELDPNRVMATGNLEAPDCSPPRVLQIPYKTRVFYPMDGLATFSLPCDPSWTFHLSKGFICQRWHWGQVMDASADSALP
jgi:hypothetical protein